MLICRKAGPEELRCSPTMCEWQQITTAPFDFDLRLAVVDRRGIHMLVFPCRRVLRSWINSEMNAQVDVHPTHWRKWSDSLSQLSVG